MFYNIKKVVLFLKKAEPQLLKKVVKSDKKTKNIFLHTSIKISGNFDIKHLWWSKTDWSKEIKKDSKKRYSTNFSSSHQEVSFIFRISPSVYLHIIKTDISSGQQPAKICQNPDIRTNSPCFHILPCWNAFY